MKIKEKDKEKSKKTAEKEEKKRKAEKAERKAEKKKKEKNKKKKAGLKIEEYIPDREPETVLRNTEEEEPEVLREQEKASRPVRQSSGRRKKEKKIPDAHSGEDRGVEHYVEVFRALGDENRMKILRFLSDGELCAAELLDMMSIVQSTLSHHMKILCESELVLCRKQGRWSYYRLNVELFEKVADSLVQQAEIIRQKDERKTEE